MPDIGIRWEWTIMKNYAVDMYLLRRTVSGQDSNGNDVYTTERLLVPQCVFVPASSSENVYFQDQVSVTDTIYMPPGVVVTAIDAIEYNGDTYEVQGTPSYFQSPYSGRMSPSRINVTKVAGVSG